jgi:hypothetical protein
MKWLSKFLGSTRTPSQSSRLNAFRLAKPWGHEIERSAHRVVWLHASGIPLSVDLVNGPLGLPLATNEHALRQACREIAELAGGAIISVDGVSIAERPATQLIYKCPEGHGYKFTGMLFLQLDGFGYVVVVAAGERGMTGGREAVVTTQLFKERKLTVESYKSGWFRDPYDPGYTGRVLLSLSDDETYDVMFPGHPLSRIRSALVHLRSTIQVDNRTEAQT